MEIKGQYLTMLVEQDPKAFMEMRRAGTLDAHLQEVSLEAHAMLDQILANVPKDRYGNPPPQLKQEAEERVRAAFLEFVPRIPDHLEPPEDIRGT